MRRHFLKPILCLASICAVAQSTNKDDVLLEKTRSSYDAPFTRNLASFDCAVQFDWKRHFEALLGSLPPAALETSVRLGNLRHRVVVNANGTSVSSEPEAADLSDSKPAAQLEEVFNAMVREGMNAWLPFSTNVILPVKPTKFVFEKTEAGFKVKMSGYGVDADLLLDSDLRVTSGVSRLPQPMRFATSFQKGPDGYLLGSVTTGSMDGSSGGDATFAYTYQSVQDFQLPLEVTVSPSTTKPWRFTLNDCKVVKFVKVNVLPPPQ